MYISFKNKTVNLSVCGSFYVIGNSIYFDHVDGGLAFTFKDNDQAKKVYNRIFLDLAYNSKIAVEFYEKDGIVSSNSYITNEAMESEVIVKELK